MVTLYLDGLDMHALHTPAPHTPPHTPGLHAPRLPGQAGAVSYSSHCCCADYYSGIRYLRTAPHQVCSRYRWFIARHHAMPAAADGIPHYTPHYELHARSAGFTYRHTTYTPHLPTCVVCVVDSRTLPAHRHLIRVLTPLRRSHAVPTLPPTHYHLPHTPPHIRWWFTVPFTTHRICGCHWTFAPLLPDFTHHTLPYTHYTPYTRGTTLAPLHAYPIHSCHRFGADR